MGQEKKANALPIKLLSLERRRTVGATNTRQTAKEAGAILGTLLLKG